MTGISSALADCFIGYSIFFISYFTNTGQQVCIHGRRSSNVYTNADILVGNHLPRSPYIPTAVLRSIKEAFGVFRDWNFLHQMLKSWGAERPPHSRYDMVYVTNSLDASLITNTASSLQFCFLNDEALFHECVAKYLGDLVSSHRHCPN